MIRQGNHCRLIVSSLKCLRVFGIDSNSEYNLFCRQSGRFRVKCSLRFVSALTLAATIILPVGFVPAMAGDITVGLITSMTGPGASIGIPYSKGTNAGVVFQDEVNGIKINVVQLDDASDPSTGARDARKLVEQDKVDVLMGAGNTPTTLAVVAVSHELKVPFLALVPTGDIPGDAGAWMVSIPQPPPLMVEAVVERMKASGVKTVGYIGFNDAWGDLVFNALKKTADPAGIQIVANERYARADTSVTAQALHVVAAAPDVVMMGGSGTPGALPFIALAERGYKNQIYGTHALINPDFVRVGGPAVEGVICPAGPVVVAEQLPDSNPTRKVAIEYLAAYKKANNEESHGGFGPYAFDAWLIMLDSAKRALATGAQPGTPEFRAALREAIVNTKELVGTHAVYNFKPGATSGVDQRAQVLVKLVDGKWKLMQ
jgi:branched-chain amino acid transport system substrate-binding protein